MRFTVHTALSHKGALCANILLDSLAALAYAQLPAITGRLIDDISGGNGSGFQQYFALYAGIVVCAVLFEILAQLVMWRVTTHFERELKDELFNSLTARRGVVHEEDSSGKTLSELTNNIAKIDQDWLTPTVAIVKDCFSIAIYAAVIANVAGGISVAVLMASTVFALLIPRTVRRELANRASLYLQDVGLYTDFVPRLIRAVPFLPPDATTTLRRQHSRLASRVAESRFSWGRCRSWSDGVAGGGSEFVLFVSFVCAGTLFADGALTVGAATALVGYARAFTSPLNDIFYDINSIGSTGPILSAFEQEVAAPASTLDIHLKVPDGRVEVQFPDGLRIASLDMKAPFVDNVSTDSRLVLSGQSGTGKTTLLRTLMMSTAEELSARVVVGGDIIPTDFPLQQVLYYSGLESPVFPASFVENATVFGAFDLDIERLSELAAGTGMLEELVRRDDMTNASSGERQFMLLARAVLSRRPILLLDESFADIDAKNTSQLVHNLSTMRLGIVIVMHHWVRPLEGGWQEVSLDKDH